MLRIVVLAVAIAFGVAACGDDDGSPRASGAGSSTTDPVSGSVTTDAGSSTTGADTSASGGTTSTDDGGETATTPTDDPSQSGGASDAERLSFEELSARQQDLVGHTVDVEGTVHFVANCPPPGGQSGPCVLTGYFADPDRDFLPYGEIGEAFPIAEGGAPVSCGQDTAAGGACPGWEQARRYRIVAVVEHRVSGGRETEQIELDVRSKTPA